MGSLFYLLINNSFYYSTSSPGGNSSTSPESKERVRNPSAASSFSSSSSVSGNSNSGLLNVGNYVRRTRADSGDQTTYYLQKSLPGGIILFEVGINEPFFYAKIYALEAARIQRSKKSRNLFNYQVDLSLYSQA